MQTFSYKGFELPIELIEKTGGGPENFDEISRWHIAQVNERIGYRADSVVVEIGCGIGRDAIPLTEILTQGRYVGIDIIRPSIEWCQQNISTRFPNFQFVHFDVEDGLHNPEGEEDVSVCHIPADDASVDIIIGHSVFTHLLEKGIRHYLGEFARVLKANGRAFVTCYVVDEDIRKRIAIEPATAWRISFLHQYGPDCWIDNLEQPLGSVAHTLDKMRSMAEAAGLSLGFVRGNWPASGSQDVLLLSRNAWHRAGSVRHGGVGLERGAGMGPVRSLLRFLAGNKAGISSTGVFGMSDDNVENVLSRDLERFVKNEAFLWGDNVAKTYFEPAETHMDTQWEMVQKFLSTYPIDYTSTMELACGHGRNSERLANLSQSMILVDVNPENILFCKKKIS